MYMIKGNLKLLGFLLFTVQLIVLLLAYSCTIRFASGSKMYCTSKSPRLLVPRSLRILVTVITSSVVFLSGRVYKMSASVKEVCKSQETNFIFHKKKKYFHRHCQNPLQLPMPNGKIPCLQEEHRSWKRDNLAGKHTRRIAGNLLTHARHYMCR